MFCILLIVLGNYQGTIYKEGLPSDLIALYDFVSNKLKTRPRKQWGECAQLIIIWSIKC